MGLISNIKGQFGPNPSLSVSLSSLTADGYGGYGSDPVNVHVLVIKYSIGVKGKYFLF